ncbi:MAG: hypothetical protein R3F14_12885 [Polyangiaceae bacterium]
MLGGVVVLAAGCRRRGATEPMEEGAYERAPEDLDNKLAYAARAKVPEAVQVEVFRGVAMEEDEKQAFGANLAGGGATGSSGWRRSR